MPKPETVAWLRHAAAIEGSAIAQTLLEVLERLDALEQPPGVGKMVNEAENDQRFHDAMAAIDRVTPEQIRAITKLPQSPAPVTEEEHCCWAASHAHVAPVAPASVLTDLSLLDELAREIGQDDKVSIWRPEARRAVEVIVRRLREPRVISLNYAASQLESWLKES